jgi:hypothetical protein
MNEEKSAATGAPTNSETQPIDLNCQMEIPQFKELGADLTVGRVFFLKCSGDLQKFDANGAQIIVRENGDHNLIKLLSAEKSGSDQVNLKVTSYRVGDHHIKNAILFSKDQTYQIPSIEAKVVTVIEKSEAKPEPYGPFGPFEILLPIWFWFVIAAIVLSVVSLISFRAVFHFKRKKFLEELRRHESSLSPLAELNLGIRRIQRNHGMFSTLIRTEADVVKVLDQSEQLLLTYLSRVFRIPVAGLAHGKILKQAKRYHRELFLVIEKDLKALFRELESMKQDVQKIHVKDCNQLLNHLRRLSDEVRAAENELAKKVKR